MWLIYTGKVIGGMSIQGTLTRAMFQKIIFKFVICAICLMSNQGCTIASNSKNGRSNIQSEESLDSGNRNSNFHQNIAIKITKENAICKPLSWRKGKWQSGVIDIRKPDELELFDDCDVIEGLINVLCSECSSLKGLERTRKIIGALRINYSNQLVDMKGLESLERIEKGGIYIGGNDSLITLAGLNNLRHVDGAVAIHQNSSLQDIHSISNSIIFAKRISLFKNESLREIGHFSRLVEVNTISITGMPVLRFVIGFSSLRKLVYLDIEQNPMLHELSGFNKLNAVEMSITVRNNLSLKRILGFEKLNEIRKFLIVLENRELEEFSMKMLDGILGGVWWEDNGMDLSQAFKQGKKYQLVGEGEVVGDFPF